MKFICKRCFVLVSLCAAIGLLTPTDSSAQEAADKLGRGFAAIVFGWLELPGNIYEEGTKNGWVMGATAGFAKQRPHKRGQARELRVGNHPAANHNPLVQPNQMRRRVEAS